MACLCWSCDVAACNVCWIWTEVCMCGQFIWLMEATWEFPPSFSLSLIGSCIGYTGVNPQAESVCTKGVCLGGCANICANISTVRYKIKIRSRIFRTYSCVWYTQYWSVWEGSPRLWFSQCHNKTNTTDSTDSECDIHWCWKWTLRVVQIGLQSFNVAMGS